MKWIMIAYVSIAITAQILLGLYTGYGQGSVGLLIFLVLVEIDPRFSFSYMVPNIKDRMNDREEKGDKS